MRFKAIIEGETNTESEAILEHLIRCAITFYDSETFNANVDGVVARFIEDAEA